MGTNPLDHPRIVAIVRRLDEGQLDEAQHLLAQLGDSPLFRAATAFLTTRLLQQRGLLTGDQVVDRLERLLRDEGDFPEARELLDATRAGTTSRPPGHAASSRPPLPRSMRREDHAVLDAELRGAFGASARREPPTNLRRPEFPESPRVPRLELPRDSEPARPPSIPDLDVPGAAPAPGFSIDLELARTPGPAPAIASEPPTVDRSHRYAGSAVSEEQVTLGKRAGEPARRRPAEDQRERTTRREPSSRPAREDPSPRIVSGAPPPAEGPIVTLFEVAKLLDAGKVREALVALGMRDGSEPDHVLMEARVLARAGRADEARDRVIRLSQAPLLDPEVRAGVARLALELGESQVAFEQARRAHQDDPDQPMICLSLAWTALRWVRRTASVEVLRVARRALSQLASAGGPNEALIAALEACAAAHDGEAEQAQLLARRALKLGPTADGHAALAMASARLGRADEVRRACAQLRELEPAEAQALEQSLARHGERLFALAADEPGASSARVVAASEDVWGPLELAIVAGSTVDAWQRFAQLAEDTLSQLKGVARREPPALATVAASFLTLAPVARDFAPWDSTPWSLARLRALLALFAGGGARIEASRSDPVSVLVGAYVGEVLREPARLEWHGTLEGGEARLQGAGFELSPFDVVRDELGGRGALDAGALEAALPRTAWKVHPRMPAVAQPCPWDPAAWPAARLLPLYALALRRSVIAAHCTRETGPLDGTPASLGALDAFVSLVAPEDAERHDDTSWARRPSVLLGAYVGQLLIDEHDARWLARDDTELDADSYALELCSGRVVRPVRFVWQRLTERAPSIEEQVGRWIDGDPSR